MPKPTRWIRTLLACGATALTAAAARAQRPVSDAELQSGTLSFHGRATVGDFIGSTSIVSGAILAGADFASTHGWVEATVATLVTGNGHRDADLRSSMEVSRYPTMRFQLDSATLVSVKPLGMRESTTVLLHGALTIHGVTRRLDVPAAIVREADTTRVAAGFPLKLTDYHIGGLTKMFGMLRMQPEIDVHVDLRFVDAPPSTPPDL